MNSPLRLSLVLTVGMIVVVSLLTVAGIQSTTPTRTAVQGFLSAHQQLRASILKASGEGYTPTDLLPVTSQLHELDYQPAPLWISLRPGFYRQLTTQVDQLQGQLKEALSKATEKAKETSNQDLETSDKAIQEGIKQGLDQATIASLQDRLHSLQAAQQSAQNLQDFRQVDGGTRQLTSDTKALIEAQVQENEQLEQAAQKLIKEKDGNLSALQQIAQSLLPKARNDATIAAYLNYGHQLQGDYLPLNIAYQRLEKYGPQANSPDLHQVALAAAASQRYSAQIHQLLIQGMPPQTIVVSFQDQALWAYQNGALVQYTLVTTGEKDLPTDFGAMHVLRKNAPWEMNSPWPKDSPHYYPPTKVKMVLWFTNTGEGLHDAPWEFPDQFGPGSQYGGAASHGCIHLPDRAESFMYNWAHVGASVIVYPGSGAPVTDQLNQMTTDQYGTPRSDGVRGV